MAHLNKPTKRSRLVPDVGPWAAALALSLLLAACGGRPTPLAGDDGGVPTTIDGAPTTDGAPGVTPTIPPTIPPSGCVVAVRGDTCCPSPHPAPAQQVAQDPCLLPYPQTEPFPEACFVNGKSCAGVKCSFQPPPSRLAKPVPGGTCAWDHECATEADCGLAYNAFTCCACPGPWPKPLIQSEPCIHDYLINGPPPAHCTAHCKGYDCKPCGGLAKPLCVVGSGPQALRICADAPASP